MKSLLLLLVAAPLLAQTTLPAGDIAADSTLSLAGSPYIVEGILRVRGSANPRLTIEPGVELRFLSGARLEIANSNDWEGDGYRGQLSAVGTAADPIRFVADTPGQVWGGLRIFNSADWNGASSQLEHVLISGADINLRMQNTASPAPQNLALEDARDDGLLLYRCIPAPALTDVSVTGSGDFALTLNGSELPLLSGFAASGNGEDRARYTGTITADLTFDLAAWPHELVFSGQTLVSSLANPCLTLPAGTELRFLQNARLDIANSNNWEGDNYRGQLMALGTVADSIRFVADTPGQYWGGLRFYNSADWNGAASQLQYARISGADTDLRLHNTTSPTPRNLLLEGARDDGLLLYRCIPAPAIENVLVRGVEDFALTLDGSELPLLSGFAASGNGEDRARYTGTITTDLTLDLAAWPYPLVFSGQTLVSGSANPRLTLPAGTELRFLQNARLDIANSNNWEGDNYRGQLMALGTVADSIRFVADTPGQYWGGLRFYNSADWNGAASQLQYARVSGADTNLRLHNTTSPTPRNLLLEGARDDGLLLYRCIPAPAIENVLVRGVEDFALTLDGSELPLLSGFTATGNGDDRARYTGTITTDLTLDLAAWPYPLVFSGQTLVSGSANPCLTLPAGTELRFLQNARLDIANSNNWEGDNYRGQLMALGTAADSIRFVADTPGQVWGGLRFYNSADWNGAASQLQYARISGADTDLRLHNTTSPTPRNLLLEGARDDGLLLYRCIPAPSVENVLVRGAAEFALALDGSALPGLSAFSATGNGDDRACYTGTITTDLTLDLSAWAWPLVFRGTTTVASSANPRLTLPAGTELRFLHNARMDIASGNNWEGNSYRGQLSAVGTAADPIRFVADDPEWSWNGLRFYNSADFGGATSDLRQVEIEGASDNLSLFSTNLPALQDVILSYADDAALTLLDAYPLVQRSWFLDSGRGLYISNADTTVIGDTVAVACSFLGNRDWDIYNDGAGHVLARHNGLCTPGGQLISDRIFDQLDDPAKGLVSYNPVGEVGLLRVTAEYRPASETLHLEWCPLFGASSYTIYGTDTEWLSPTLTDTVATTTDTWLDLPLGDLPVQHFYTLRAEIAASRRASALRGACR